VAERCTEDRGFDDGVEETSSEASAQEVFGVRHETGGQQPTTWGEGIRVPDAIRDR
jgi:hypothetical protein